MAAGCGLVSAVSGRGGGFVAAGERERCSEGGKDGVKDSRSITCHCEGRGGRCDVIDANPRGSGASSTDGTRTRVRAEAR